MLRERAMLPVVLKMRFYCPYTLQSRPLIHETSFVVNALFVSILPCPFSVLLTYLCSIKNHS